MASTPGVEPGPHWWEARITSNWMLTWPLVHHLKLTRLKKKVRLKMVNNFDEHVFDSLMGEIVKTKMPLCLTSLKELKEKVLLARVAQW